MGNSFDFKAIFVISAFLNLFILLALFVMLIIDPSMVTLDAHNEYIYNRDNPIVLAIPKISLYYIGAYLIFHVLASFYISIRVSRNPSGLNNTEKTILKLLPASFVVGIFINYAMYDMVLQFYLLLRPLLAR